MRERRAWRLLRRLLLPIVLIEMMVEGYDRTAEAFRALGLTERDGAMLFVVAAIALACSYAWPALAGPLLVAVGLSIGVYANRRDRMRLMARWRALRRYGRHGQHDPQAEALVAEADALVRERHLPEKLVDTIHHSADDK